MSSHDLYRLALAGDWLRHRPPAAVLEELRGLVASLIHVGNVTDQFLIRGMVVHALARVGLVLQFELYPGLLQSYLALAAAPWQVDDWIPAFARAADRFERAVREANDLRTGASPLEVRVSKALHFIDSRYADHDLSIEQAAGHSGLSVSHLTHALKQRTGHGFVAHLRRRRIDAAARLLEQSVLSVKEIAGAVGYGSTRHFERDFKRLHGTTAKESRGNGAPVSASGDDSDN